MVAALRFVLKRAPESNRQWQVTAGGTSPPGCRVRLFVMDLVWAAAVLGTEFTCGHIWQDKSLLPLFSHPSRGAQRCSACGCAFTALLLQETPSLVLVPLLPTTRVVWGTGFWRQLCPMVLQIQPDIPCQEIPLCSR